MTRKMQVRQEVIQAPQQTESTSSAARAEPFPTKIPITKRRKVELPELEQEKKPKWNDLLRGFRGALKVETKVEDPLSDTTEQINRFRPTEMWD